MKMIFLVIWIKAIALIGVLLVNTHRAYMTLDELEATLQFEIATDATPMKINPDGPLNLLRGYIYQKMDCMYNKRFFAPQINTKYSLEENINNSGPSNLSYTYTRNEQKDKAYTAQSNNKMDIYTEKYHKHLIELFPSPTGDITIETRGSQSFIQFLRAKTTEKHSLQILAMLLLFSEGVDIPIEVTNDVLKVYETNKKNEIYFTVPMRIPWLEPRTNSVEMLSQKKVKQLINFFQENATNSEALSLMMDRCSLEEVATGKFLDSPKFLIQSYIFEFIDSAQRAKEFVQTIHAMTEKYAPKTEAPSKDDSVYDRLFKPAGTEVGIDCMALMKQTQEILNTYRVFPFINSTQIPIYKSVPRYNRKLGMFSTNQLENYSNCVECMILSLFCCLAYDPSDFTYKTDHMGNVSKELKEFFSLGNQSFDTTKANFQKNWCRVVACLDEPRISYCRDRNELEPGIINMLMVIAEIVNISKDEKEKILGFSQRLKEKKGGLEDELSNSIEEYTTILLKRLSKTESVEIEFSELKSHTCTEGRYDISGEITIAFEHSGIKNAIVLGISEGHSTINMKPAVMKIKDTRIKQVDGIAGICKNAATFVENLFAVYAAYEIRKIDTPENNEEFIKAQIRKTIKKNFTDINRLLLVKKINDFSYKKSLFTYSILYSMNQKLFPEHPIIRFTSNIIGSTELNNGSIISRMSPPIIFSGLLSKSGSNLNYPNIKLKEERYQKDMGYIRYYWFVKYILDCDINIFIQWIKYCIGHFDKYDGKGMYNLLGFKVTKPIYEYMFKAGDMKYADAVDKAIAQAYPDKKDEIINNLHYIWFVYLIREANLKVKLAKTNFHAIRSTKYEQYGPDYVDTRQIVNNLRQLKKHVCIDESSIAKFREFMRIYSQ
ncbi:hypothetical protein NERG_01890 [Nematocida ausubeli]|uniref:Uncharacterized protein n=1 Tax=Nematocida ausubeli (strain ATCC PRA-371 / ERTm2) TaxID=1913371 RepID=H8ZE69_NEMA1|nr:hypothetical protein NERG_01890 [Nematocida ausubeli]